MREELQAQPQNKEPLNAVLKGMFGVKWQKALRKEWRDMAGRTDGRELWAEVQMVGSTLGETLEQQKRKFFEVLPEEVQAQLVSQYLGEEAVLKLDWEDKMLLEVAFLWKSGKPTLARATTSWATKTGSRPTTSTLSPTDVVPATSEFSPIWAVLPTQAVPAKWSISAVARRSRSFPGQPL